MILELPTTLVDRYEVTRYLGAGTFAETYAARDIENDQEVAVKLLRSSFVNDRETLTRFEREAQATSEIVHPHVVRTLDYHMDGQNPFMVMEYVSGPNLKTLLFQNGTFTPEQAVTYTIHILAGLDAIHQRGMVHRDIKPHNILTDPELGARLSDFGIARALDQTGLTRTGTALGTATYMAPEQATGKEITPAADLYAVGVMMFEMLTGETPFKGNDPLEVLYQQVHQAPPSLREFNQEVPEWLERISLRAMAKEPTDRFESAAAMIQALNSGTGSEDDTRAMDPALMAAQAATAAMPVAPSAAAPKPRRNQRAVPPAAPPPPSRPVEPRKTGSWYRTPVFILLALVLMVAAIVGLYAIGTGDSPADDEPGTIIEEPADDEPATDEVDEPAPEPPPDEEQPAEPEAPADEAEPAPEEEPDPAPEEDEPAPENETDQDPVEEEETDQGEGNFQGAPGQSDQDNPGQGNDGVPPGQDNQDDQNPGQSEDNPGQANN